MSVRGGWDVTEIVHIKETTFGQTPTSGVWDHFGDWESFDPRRTPVYKPRIGFGRQYPKSFTKIKEYAELDLEARLLLKDAPNSYEWLNPFALIWGEDAAAATIDFEKHIGSMSIGAKLDLATDEYLLVKGCKYESGAIRAAIEETVVHVASFIGTKHTHTETDYVSGTATRRTFPTTGELKYGDTDFLIAAASVIERLQGWEFRIRREMQKRGTDDADSTLYAKFAEVGCSLESVLTLDFDSRAELDNFMSDTTFNIEIQCPKGSGGRKINLPTCQWKEMRKPQRNLDLIELSLTAECMGTPTITTIP